jgi:hypothetical protein
MQVTLREFCLDDMQLPSSIFILGVSQSGKSTLVKQLIPNHCFTIMFSAAQPSIYNYDNMDSFPEVVQKIEYRSTALRASMPKMPPCSLVIDDLVHEPDGIMSDDKAVNRAQRWEYTTPAKKVISDCKEFGTTFILASRYMLIQKPLINKVDYVFIFPTCISDNKTRMQFAYNYYCKHLQFISKDIFGSCLNSLENGQVLVIDNVRQSIYYFNVDYKFDY